MKTKDIILSLTVPIIEIAVFNVIVFTIFDYYGDSFWCGYTFVTVSWIMKCIVGYIAVNDEDGCYLNAPGMLISIVHFGIQLCIAIVLMAIELINLKYIFCLELVVLAVYATNMIALYFYKEEIRK